MAGEVREGVSMNAENDGTRGYVSCHEFLEDHSV